MSERAGSMKATLGVHEPKKAGDAGYDLIADEPDDFGVWTIPARGYRVIDTAAKVEIPEGYCGLIVGRSSLNTKGLVCCVGLVDSGYRGFIKVLIQNLNDNGYIISEGDRVAQLVLVPYTAPVLQYVNGVDEFDVTERGESGFGSTGK